MADKRGFGTRAIHAGQRPDPETGAVMTPVYQTSTYAQDRPGMPRHGYDYSRAKNPTRDALEANLADLEGGRYAYCFASGCSAMAAVLHLLKAGDHVLLSRDVYGGTYRLLDKVFTRHGIRMSQVDMKDPEALRPHFTEETKLVWIETPSNPLLEVIDVEKTAAIAAEHGALLAVDNTFATPFLQNPLSLGADIVSHSSTKYIGGHSDVIGGVVVVNDDDLAERLKFVQLAVGAVPAPWDCYLLLRSTKTLHVRMVRHCQNARAVARFLVERDDVEKVLFPGLADHPGHEIAARQMRDFGGMVSAVLSGGLERTLRFLEQVEVFTLGESLGGVESLIEHPAIMTHASIPADIRAELGIADGLIRLSVGIEDEADLLADLEQALDGSAAS